MSRHLPISNPQNRFASTRLEYDDGEIPNAEIEIYEDQSKTILATNNSPDVGFKWSVNPYRGCLHGCAYCVHPETLILKGDGRSQAISELRVGDEIYGTRVEGDYRRYVRTHVLAHWETWKHAYKIKLVNGTELIASGDHRFLSNRGWKHVRGAEQGPLQRPHLTLQNALLGMGKLIRTPPRTADYERGYLCGVIRGDGSIFEKHYPATPTRWATSTRSFRLALIDLQGLRRTRFYLEHFGVFCSAQYMFQRATKTRKRVMAMRATRSADIDMIRRIIQWPQPRPREWSRGFLAGLFDAEGSFGDVIRISNGDPRMLDEIERALDEFGFNHVRDRANLNGVVSVRIRGGLSENLRFFQLVDPAIKRKLDIEGIAVKAKNNSQKLKIASITDLGFSMCMFDITTGTGDFIANGVISHNCYARPTHEYLSFGAGSDFSRKIVVKPRAAELLREAFEKKSWKGELVVFSGITDCYQPLENKMKITRQCLEVCAEYKNPVGIITKSPIIERDIDVLQEIARVASVRISVSVPFWDPDVARAMEPMVTTPERRMKIIEALAKAGLCVGISVSPIVPGLNDDHLGDVLERARDAGARHAFYVLLRLPGAVKEVFEAAMREKLPLRAEKVLRRLREAHGGKLYDSTFGQRGKGEGVYADTIRMLFERTAKRCGLNADEMSTYLTASTFARPSRRGQTSFGF